MTQRAQSAGSGGLKPREVCARLGIQPYVLKFWEGEFPQLGQRVGAKRIYGEEELEILGEIQRLVDVERLNLGEARRALGLRFSDRPAPKESGSPLRRGRGAATSDGLLDQARQRIRELEADLEQSTTDLRRRSQEFAQLRRQLTDAETRAEAADSALAEAKRAIGEEEARRREVVEEIDALLDEVRELRREAQQRLSESE